jgi:hypothetical protein
MAFINKDSLVLIEGKLTNIGRQLLAYGNLTFNKFAVGDSEMDYQFLEKYTLTASNQNILRPVDSQPNMRYPVLLSSTSTEYLANIPSVTANERLIKNTAKERGFFNRAVTSNPGVTPVTYGPYRVDTSLTAATTTISSIADPLSFAVASATGIGVGTMLLIQWFPNDNSNPAPTAADNVEAAVPRAWLWYKAVTVNGTTITVDRKLPDFSGSLTGNVYAYPALNNQVSNYESGVTNPYWNTESLTFQNPASSNTSDVPVWNFSIIYGNSVAGALPLQRADNYPSATYEGLRSYLGVTNPNTPVGVLHYTNHSNNNYYGEGFFNDSLVLELPTVMYHNSATATMGMTLTAESNKRNLVSTTSTSTNFSLTYYNLLGPDQKVVGKIFTDLKIVVIEDGELLTALSYASNRNWTLPGFTQFSVSAASSNTGSPYASGTPSTDSLLYVTYALGNVEGSGNGYHNSMICQDYRVGRGTGFTGFQFAFHDTDLKFLNAASSGIGFNATQFTILFQIVAPDGTLEHDKWVPLPFNTPIGATGSAPITAAMLAQRTWSVSQSDMDAAVASAKGNDGFYKIDYLNAVLAPALTFGSEQLFFGNLKTDIKAVTFATTFRFQLDNGLYDKSTNPTWNPTLPVQITEVGIYDNNNNLVVSGKLNYPLRKDSDEIVLISLDMDF